MRSIFGWSYPPGCSGPPEEDTTCPGCGKDSELEAEKGGCQCDPCKECGNPGCAKHMPQRELIRELQRLEMVADYYRQEAKRRYAEKPVICQQCKKPLSFGESMNPDCWAMHSGCEAEYERSLEQ